MGGCVYIYTHELVCDGGGAEEVLGKPSNKGR